MVDDDRAAADAASHEGRDAGRSRRYFSRNRPVAPQSRAIVIFLTVAAVAVAMIVAGESGSDDLSLELAKSGLQLLVVAIFGGAVSQAFRSLDAHREELRRIDAYRAATVDKLFDAYHQVKAVRRALRAAGFYEGTAPTITASHSSEFHARMALLNDAQLALERLNKDVMAHHVAFGANREVTAGLIRAAENYVKKVVSDWEKYGTKVSDGAEFRAVTDPLRNLTRFLGRSSRDTGGIKLLSDPIYEAVDRIQSLRFGADPSNARQRRAERPRPTSDST